MPFVRARVGASRRGWVRRGCPVWNQHECSLSSLRHHTSLPSFTAVHEGTHARLRGAGGGERASGGWGLGPASELIGTAMFFYPPTESMLFFGRHTSVRRTSSLSCFLPLLRRGDPHPRATSLTTDTRSGLPDREIKPTCDCCLGCTVSQSHFILVKR